MKNIKDDYYDLTIDFIKNICDEINEVSIKNILEQFNDNIINHDMKRLIMKFLLERRKRMLEIYNMEDEV